MDVTTDRKWVQGFRMLTGGPVRHDKPAVWSDVWNSCLGDKNNSYRYIEKDRSHYAPFRRVRLADKISLKCCSSRTTPRHTNCTSHWGHHKGRLQKTCDDNITAVMRYRRTACARGSRGRKVLIRGGKTMSSSTMEAYFQERYRICFKTTTPSGTL